ncbi:lipase member H-like isoform X1 [Petromyzon marinus]|uniref:lipase member H-like isoform X1 n=1 Tax=Petromyzon marinus TaxID=7757 RepID=UPI003F6FEAEF
MSVGVVSLRVVSFLMLLCCWVALTIAASAAEDGDESGGGGGGGEGGGRRAAAATEEECSDFSKLDLGDAFRGTEVKVRFLLYPAGHRHACGVLLNVSAAGKLLSAATVPSSVGGVQERRVTFIVHGFRISGSKPVWLDSMVATLHAVRPEGDVIVVDWNHGATHLVYSAAVKNVRPVAMELAHLIHRLVRDGEVLPARVHLIGASLGAHISGMAGANLNGSLGRISALDAAGPEFEDRNADDRLDHTDAGFVDVYHSDTDMFGIKASVGHVDFYVNGGEDQPGCPKTILQGKEFVICDHQRSSFFFLASMRAPCSTIGFPCESREALRQGLCSDCDVGPIGACPVLGYWAERWLPPRVNFSGVVAYAETSSTSPFCAVYYEVEVSVGGEEWWSGVSGYLSLRLVGANHVTSLTHLSSSPLWFGRGDSVLRVVAVDSDPGDVGAVLATFGRAGVRHRYRRGASLAVRRLQLSVIPRRGAREYFCTGAATLLEDKALAIPATRC